MGSCCTSVIQQNNSQPIIMNIDCNYFNQNREQNGNLQKKATLDNEDETPKFSLKQIESNSMVFECQKNIEKTDSPTIQSDVQIQTQLNNWMSENTSSIINKKFFTIKTQKKYNYKCSTPKNDSEPLTLEHINSGNIVSCEETNQTFSVIQQ